MKFLMFQNAGLIDPVMFKTFGVSVKEGDDAIGFFGTGLKYAIAVVLRERGNICISSGTDRYEFGVSTITLRGKEFELVTCNGVELGFTTELGKQWEVWMAYRELFSNCLDEHGEVSLAAEALVAEGETRIFVDCPQMMQVHHSRHTVFLQGTPLFVGESSELLPGPSKYLFYKGVRVAELSFASVFTHNITRHIDLTEDRTVRYDFQVENAITRTLAVLTDSQMVRKLFNADDRSFERTMAFSSSLDFSDEFVATARACYRANPKSVHASLSTVIHKRDGTSMFVPCTLTAVEEKKLAAAVRFCSSIGFDSSPYGITVVETLGPDMLALARREEQLIVLSRRVFHQGLKQLCSTLIEEVVHLKEGLDDCSRNMQTFLFDFICTMGEQLTGESL